MTFEEFRISKRGENECQYSDNEQWLRERDVDTQRVMRGGDNFTWVGWGNFLELPLWVRIE